MAAFIMSTNDSRWHESVAHGSERKFVSLHEFPQQERLTLHSFELPCTLVNSANSKQFVLA